MGKCNDCSEINRSADRADVTPMSTEALAQNVNPGGATLRLAGAKKRRTVRAPHVMDAWICSPTAVQPMEERREVRSINISRHGIGFSADCELATGAFWIVEVGFGEQRLLSEIRIVNCRKAESGRFEVGAEFC